MGRILSFHRFMKLPEKTSWSKPLRMLATIDLPVLPTLAGG
jgi:hypothetical protein